MISDSWEQILSNKNRLQLIAKLKKNDFTMGCNYCANAFSQANYAGMGSNNYDFIINSSNTKIKHLEFELDTLCNLNCMMCPPELHSSNSQSIYGDKEIAHISQLFDKISWAKFYGGEPMVIKSYYKIWELLIKTNKNCAIKIQTNGTVINEKIKSLIKKGKFLFMISLDSLIPEVYEKIRLGAQLQKVLQNIEFLSEYSKENALPIDIAICPMTLNAKEIPDLINFCNNKGFFINFNILESPRNLSLKSLSIHELSELLAYYKGVRINKSNLSEYLNKQQFISLQNQIQSWIKAKQEHAMLPSIELLQNHLKTLLFSNMDEIKKNACVEKYNEFSSQLTFPLIFSQKDYETLQLINPDEMFLLFQQIALNDFKQKINEISEFGL